MIKILVLDHIKVNLQNLQNTVSRLIPDAKLFTTAEGNEAINIANKNNPDVILLETSGEAIQVCQKLKENIRTQNIPVVFIADAQVEKPMIAKAIENGGEGLLTRPLNELELLVQIRAMVKLKKAGPANQTGNNHLQKLVDKQTRQLSKELAARKKTEKALREQEQILKQAQEIAHVGSWEFDLMNNAVNWSENSYRLFGFKPFSVIPSYQLFMEMVHPDDKKLIPAVIEKIKKTRKPEKLEYRIITPNEKLKWLQNNILPIFEGNQIMKLRGVNFDITERKHAEQDLKKAMQLSKEQELFSRLNAEISTELIDVNLENIDEKINAALAKTGKHTKCDRAFVFLFKEDKTLMDNTHEWCTTGVKSNLGVLNDIPVPESVWWMKNFSRKKHVYFSGSENEEKPTTGNIEIPAELDVTSLLSVPIFKGKELIGFMGLTTIADEKTWNDFHIQTIKSIASSIASAFSSVQNQKQLLAAKEKAEESDRLKSAFLANMSHEIRTPMNGIMGFLDLIRNNGNSKEEQNLYFEMVKKSSDRLLTTISDIIEISKIESGQTPVVHSIENVNEIMNFLYKTFEPEAAEKGIALLLSENIRKNSDKTIRIKTDKLKLEIILKNLIGNAIKFTSEGSVEMDYALTQNSITFCIKDTGPGIAQNRIEAIFDRFVQADLDITRPYEGAGLGLTITRAYAEMLHGNIRVESEVGKGSRFYFTLNHDSIMN